MNAPASVVFPTHTTFEWSLAVSAFAIGGPGGAVLGGYLANKKGRKGTYTTTQNCVLAHYLTDRFFILSVSDSFCDYTNFANEYRVFTLYLTLLLPPSHPLSLPLYPASLLPSLLLSSNRCRCYDDRHLAVFNRRHNNDSST